MSEPAVLYVVQRLNWVSGEWYAMEGPLTRGFFRIPGVVRLCSFDTEAEAEAERDRREERVRRVVNPFLCGGVHLRHQTSFDADRLHDWLLDADITPPADGDWAAWWPTIKDRLSEDQWRHFWKALDRLVFHEVVPRPRKPVVYVIGQIGWKYNDQGFDSQPEGSKPLRAYRSRQRAEEECAEENEIARSALDLDENDRNPEDEEYDMGYRQSRVSLFGVEEGGKRPLAFYEVIEVELEEESTP